MNERAGQPTDAGMVALVKLTRAEDAVIEAALAWEEHDATWDQLRIDSAPFEQCHEWRIKQGDVIVALRTAAQALRALRG